MLICSFAIEFGASFHAPSGACPRRSARPVLDPGFRPVSLVASLREAERRIGASLVLGTSCEGARLPITRQARLPGAPPRRFVTRSPYFFHRTRRLGRPVIEAALALPFIRSCPSH